MSNLKLSRNLSRSRRMFKETKSKSLFIRLCSVFGRSYLDFEILGHFSLLNELDYTFLGSLDQSLYKISAKYLHSGATYDFYFKDYSSAEDFFKDCIKKTFI